MMLKNQKGPACRQAGFLHLWLIIAILISLTTAWVLYSNFKPVTKPNPKPVANVTSAPTIDPTSLPATSPNTSAPQQVKKGDLESLEKYCMEEVLKLPEGPFTYKSKEGPTLSGPMPWVDKYIPKDKKQSEKKACTMAYRFDGRSAYGSVGTTYPGGLIEFKKTVYERFAAKLDSSWVRIKPDEQIFKRENPEKGTVDFVDIFDGGLVIYIKFNTYYK